MKAIGCWMYVGESSNVGQVGLQFYDAEGEALSFLQPVDWTGWKWIETPITAEQRGSRRYPQKRQELPPRPAAEKRERDLVLEEVGPQWS